MDTGEGNFIRIPDLTSKTMETMMKKYPKAKGVFTIGEELEIRGSLFMVKDISPFGIKLKLLKPK